QPAPSATASCPLSLHDALPIFKEENLPIGLAVIEAFLQKDREGVARLGQAQANIVTDMARAGVLDAFNIAGDLSREEQKQLLSIDRKSTRLNSSHVKISYAVFC